MLKKLVLALMLVAIVPGFANAWYVNSKISGTAAQGSITPSGNKTYAAGVNSDEYTVTPGIGYMLNRVTLDGAVLVPNANGKYVAPYVASLTWRYLVAYFTAASVNISTVVGANGAILESNFQSLNNIPIGAGRTLQVVPNQGYQIATFSATGSPTIIDLIDRSKIVAYSNLQANQTVSATFSLVPIVTANAGNDVSTQGDGAAYAATLFGTQSTSNQGAISYLWTGPAGLVFGTPTAAVTTAYSSTPGDYTATLTITSGGITSSDTVNVHVVSRTEYLANACVSCHSLNQPQVTTDYYASQHGSKISCQSCHGDDAHANPLPPLVWSGSSSYCATCHTPAIVSDFSASAHRAAGVTCTSCHKPGVHNPDPIVSACNGCHVNAQGNVPRHPFAFGQQSCVTCHNPHSSVGSITVTPTAAHFNNLTSAGYPASYVTSEGICENCHYFDGGLDLNATNRRAWAGSGHAATTAAAWSEEDFKTKSGCVQCHTTTGFIAYSTGRVTAAWGTADDKSKELLTCIGCHTDISTGAVRSLSPVSPYADDSYINHDCGISNICARCHSGLNNGSSIAVKVGVADFSDLPYVAAHQGLPAAGNLHGKAGYHFPGQAYSFYSSNSHRLVGMGNRAGTGNAGPCVACHMSAADQHEYNTVARDANGAISAVTATMCVKCHGSSLQATNLGADQAAFSSALNVLRLTLADKGFFYTASAPYFNNTNWGSGQAGANVMGAAYNYQMLLTEPGAYAHNPAYTRKLITDSIDYLHNGTITGSIDSALASLVSSGSISQQTAEQVAGYQTSKTTCASCHQPASTGTHAGHLADGFSCDKCHNATALSNTSLVPATLSHVNGQVEVVIGSPNNQSGGSNFSKGPNTCSGVSCHGNGTQTVSWGAAGLVTCESCHSGVLSVIDGVTARDRSLSTSRGHGRPGIGNLCLDCHDRQKRHLGGAGRLVAPLSGLLNRECNYCHDDATLITNVALRNMGSHINVNGQSAACSDCHDPHGTSNLSMIRSTILGQTITFTQESELVNLSTNMGLCQVCHTRTKYYRAGEAETNHDTSACFGCHDHKSENGGFLTRTTRQCDSCHGYPPAPRETAVVVGFGVMDNWSGARFERYSGGGGAHLVDAHVPQSAVPKDGWRHCNMCHNAEYHRQDLMPDNPPLVISQVRVEVQAQYRFAEGFTVYTGAKLVDPPARNVTGSCFNLSCHMTPSPRWSTER